MLPHMRAVCASPLYQSELIGILPYIYRINIKAIKVATAGHITVQEWFMQLLLLQIHLSQSKKTFKDLPPARWR